MLAGIRSHSLPHCPRLAKPPRIGRDLVQIALVPVPFSLDLGLSARFYASTVSGVEIGCRHCDIKFAPHYSDCWRLFFYYGFARPPRR